MKNEIKYGFYSKVLNKPFDTIDELVKAEEEHNKAEEAKRLKIEERKNEAKKVEEAFKCLNLVKSNYFEKVTEAEKECAKKIAAVKEEYNKTIKVERDVLEEAEKAYNAALKEFTDKHPEGYHLTLKDGDNVKTIYKTSAQNVIDDFFTSFFRLF